MKTFVVLSDSHGRSVAALKRVVPLFAENDYVIHLGDGFRDISEAVAEHTNAHLLHGNCDLVSGTDECVIEEEGHSLLCCHGHKYSVKQGLSGLVGRAKALGCDIALYGHTHHADISEVDGVLCINPGALCDRVEPSYCYLVLNGKEKVAKIVHL